MKYRLKINLTIRRPKGRYLTISEIIKKLKVLKASIGNTDSYVINRIKFRVENEENTKAVQAQTRTRKNATGRKRRRS